MDIVSVGLGWTVLLALNMLVVGVVIVGVLWTIQRLRRIGPLERRVTELELRVRQAEMDQTSHRPTG